MTGEIINRVANSNLITIDLSDYAPKSAIKILNIKDFLFEDDYRRLKLTR